MLQAHTVLLEVRSSSNRYYVIIMDVNEFIEKWKFVPGTVLQQTSPSLFLVMLGNLTMRVSDRDGIIFGNLCSVPGATIMAAVEVPNRSNEAAALLQPEEATMFDRLAGRLRKVGIVRPQSAFAKGGQPVDPFLFEVSYMQTRTPPLNPLTKPIVAGAVNVLGTSKLANNIGDLARKSGYEAFMQVCDIDAATRPTLTVVVHDPSLEWQDAAALARPFTNQQHLVLCCAQRGLVGSVGPLVVPGESACVDCVRERFRTSGGGSRGANLQLWTDEVRWPAPARHLSGLPPSLAPADGEDIGAAASQTLFAAICNNVILKILAGADSLFRVNEVLKVDLAYLTLEPEAVLKMPRCATCRAARERPFPPHAIRGGAYWA